MHFHFYELNPCHLTRKMNFPKKTKDLKRPSLGKFKLSATYLSGTLLNRQTEISPSLNSCSFTFIICQAQIISLCFSTPKIAGILMLICNSTE